jgi:endo-1,4-beta-D-glucanase Y
MQVLDSIRASRSDICISYNLVAATTGWQRTRYQKLSNTALQLHSARHAGASIVCQLGPIPYAAVFLLPIAA